MAVRRHCVDFFPCIPLINDTISPLKTLTPSQRLRTGRDWLPAGPPFRRHWNSVAASVAAAQLIAGPLGTPLRGAGAFPLTTNCPFLAFPEPVLLVGGRNLVIMGWSSRIEESMHFNPFATDCDQKYSFDKF